MYIITFSSFLLKFAGLGTFFLVNPFPTVFSGGKKKKKEVMNTTKSFEFYI